jgi:FHA domain
MEPIEPVVSHSESSAPPSVPGELVVQNGRLAGTRRLLKAPLTLIGRAADCDIRLNIDSIHPLHCAIFPSPAGPIVRDLGSQSGILVNNLPVSTSLLRDGDILGIGPFQFLVRWTPPPVEEKTTAHRAGELDALRVQAAAVAAQQATLFDEENRLLQRRVALEKQEEQLAAHLEERRKGLVTLQEEVRRERALLHQERASLDQERLNRLAEAERDRAEAGRNLAKSRTERKRLTELRRRLKKRWKKHWSEHEGALRVREQEIQRRSLNLAQEQRRLQKERDDLTHGRLRLNGDRELTRCETREQWQKLHQAQRDWQEEKQRQTVDLDARKSQLEERAATVRKMEEALTAQRQQAQTLRDDLSCEAEGLEKRIGHLRNVLSEVQTQHGALPEGAFSQSATTRVLLDEESASCLARLETMAQELADQRLALAEQWKGFLETQREWHEEVAPQLEQAVRQLEGRERRLGEREQAMIVAGEKLRQRFQAFTQLRSKLEAWEAGLAATEGLQEHERSVLLAQVQASTEANNKKQLRLEDLRKRWLVRRKEEVTRLTRELQRCRELQRLYVSVRGEYERRGADMGSEQRNLAEGRLALEQLELECVGRAEDAAAAEKRLQKIRRHIATLHSEAEKRLADRGRHLEEEAERLAAQSKHLQKRLESVTENEGTLSIRQTEWENRLMKAEQSRESLELEVQALRREEGLAARRCQELQQELERVISVMLEEVEPSEQSSPQAA